MENSKVHILFIVLGFNLVVMGGCLSQIPFEEDDSSDSVLLEEEQCVTPLKRLSLSVDGGISTTLDGSLCGVARNFGAISLFNNEGEILWTREGIGSRYALLTSDGQSMLVESYNKKEPWKSTIVKFDSKGNILWEKLTGSVEPDGLAVTPDGSFIAVGATDEEKNGHLMLFDGDGNVVWKYQPGSRITAVAVSKHGYVVASTRDMVVRVYDSQGEVIFTFSSGEFYDTQEIVISNDESFFLCYSEHRYVTCFTLQGELLWKREVRNLIGITISEDGEYIVVSTCASRLYLLDKNGNELWNKKVTDAFFIEEVAISANAEYIAVNAQEGEFLPRLYIHVYNREGEFLWKYEGKQPFMAIAVSGDGHYIVAGNQNTLVFFDNFQAIEEYALNECRQSMRFTMTLL